MSESVLPLTDQEWNLIRQAARNQNDDERREAERVTCSACRSRQMEFARQRARTREDGLNKIRPEGLPERDLF